jgi:hypothetical protein
MSEIRYVGYLETFQKKEVDSDGTLRSPHALIQDSLLFCVASALEAIPHRVAQTNKQTNKRALHLSHCVGSHVQARI